MKLFFAVLLGLTAAAQSLQFDVGNVLIRPGGFLDFISEYRSGGSSDTVSMRYASLPLGDAPGDYKYSFAHSRLQTHIEIPIESARFIVYLEARFSPAAR